MIRARRSPLTGQGLDKLDQRMVLAETRDALARQGLDKLDQRMVLAETRDALAETQNPLVELVETRYALVLR